MITSYKTSNHQKKKSVHHEEREKRSKTYIQLDIQLLFSPFILFFLTQCEPVWSPLINITSRTLKAERGKKRPSPPPTPCLFNKHQRLRAGTHFKALARGKRTGKAQDAGCKCLDGLRDVNPGLFRQAQVKIASANRRGGGGGR